MADVPALAMQLRAILLPGGVRTQAIDSTSRATKEIRALTLAEYDDLRDLLSVLVQEAEQELSDSRYLEKRVTELADRRTASANAAPGGIDG